MMPRGSSFEHHEKEAGLLFQTGNNRSAITACQRAVDKYGKEVTMEVISKYIPLDNPQLPILHHVEAKHAPKYLNDFLMHDFLMRYTSAAYMKDSDAHNLDRAMMLVSRKTTFESNAMYFMRTLSDDQAREIDPLTDLYPFMVAASEQTSDLSAVFVLLRRNPSLVGGGHLHDGNDRLKRKRIGDCNRIKRSKNH